MTATASDVRMRSPIQLLVLTILKAHGGVVASVLPRNPELPGSSLAEPFHFCVLKRFLIGLLLVVKLGVMFYWG